MILDLPQTQVAVPIAAPRAAPVAPHGTAVVSPAIAAAPVSPTDRADRIQTFPLGTGTGRATSRTADPHLDLDAVLPGPRPTFAITLLETERLRAAATMSAPPADAAGAGAAALDLAGAGFGLVKSFASGS